MSRLRADDESGSGWRQFLQERSLCRDDQRALEEELPLASDDS